MIKLTKQLHFFVTESFRRDKVQAQAYDKFREGVVFKDVNGNKYSLRNAHMGHNPEDAVSYWNRCGRYHEAKSQVVRKWMLDSNNYRLEYELGNCSRGAKSKERYKNPRKPKTVSYLKVVNLRRINYVFRSSKL